MQATKSLHTTVKYLELVIAVSVLLYFGKPLFVPLFFGLLTAIVLVPVCRRLEKNGASRYLAILICLLIVTVLIAALVLLLLWQVNMLQKDAPAIMAKASVFIHQLITEF